MANFCPECGKQLNGTEKFCTGCGNVINNKVDVPSRVKNKQNPLFPDCLKYRCSFLSGSINSMGGYLIITPTQLIFHPDKFNFGNTNDRVFDINMILGYGDCWLPPWFKINLINGNHIMISSYKKNTIIQQLEARRTNIIVGNT